MKREITFKTNTAYLLNMGIFDIFDIRDIIKKFHERAWKYSNNSTYVEVRLRFLKSTNTSVSKNNSKRKVKK